MEAGTLQVFLRVLYTVNSSPQYILAKSSSQVTAITCNEGTVQSIGYARAPLKACLAAVCDSSPELLQDPERDYSLYVLDPLESQPPPSHLTSTYQNSGSPRGVAVALGLMSWALGSSYSGSAHVTGTLISSPSPSLEVVFALRETKRMHKLMVHASHSWGQAATAPGPSQPTGYFQPQTGAANWSSALGPHAQAGQQEPRTLTRSADFPELYIGPPRRSRGRPEGSTSSKSKSKPANARSESKPEEVMKSKQKSRSRPMRPQPASSPFICAPLTRPVPTGYPASSMPLAIPSSFYQPYMTGQQLGHAQPQVYSQPYSCSHPTYNPLLGFLTALSASSGGSIMTNSTPEQQAALLSALQGVLTTNPQLLQLATPCDTDRSTQQVMQTPKETIKREDEVDDEDSDIIILDSSTIDTTAFRKSGTRRVELNGGDTKGSTPPPTNAQDFPLPTSIQGTDASPMPASTPSSVHESTPASSQISTPSVAPDSTPTPSSDADPNAETPTSQCTPSRRTERISGAISPSVSVRTTPTPSHTRKRKLVEYVQGHAHPSSSASPYVVPASPSPTVLRTSSSARGFNGSMRQRRVKSSPSRSKVLSSSPARLPSMLDAMRASTAARLQTNSSGSSKQTLLASSAGHRNAVQSADSVSGPSSRHKADSLAVVANSSSAAHEDGAAAKRRRTLNEVMAEQEREREKVRKRSSSKRELVPRAAVATFQETQLRPTRSAPIPKHAQSSPPRPLFRSGSVASASQYLTSTSKSGSASYPVVFNPAFAPTSISTTTAPGPASASTSTVAATKNPLKNFVLPAWARTSTATLPRLSEEALARQQAEREAKKALAALRRRDAAKAKRKRVGDDALGVDPSKESSEDEEEMTKSPELRAPASTSRSAPLLPTPPLPTLPVFASDAVEPIPSSPLPSQHQLPPPPIIPSTPPRKRVSLGSGAQQTPGQPGSGSSSLFTPAASLFTPSTPNGSRSLSRNTYTPRSPSAPRRSATKKSPLKSLVRTPKTPKRDKGKHQAPRSVHSGRKTLFASPGAIPRTPQTQTSVGTRTFLLPPSSPCSMRTPPQQKGKSGVLEGSSPLSARAGIPKVKSPLDMRKSGRNAGSMEDALDRELDAALHGLEVPSQPPHSAVEEGRDLHDATGNEEIEEDFPSSPLPPSSPPPPTSPLSSPAKHPDFSFHAPDVNDLTVPDSDVLLPSASDTDVARGPSDMAWLSDDTAPAAWFTDSEANAWFSETEAWLTDTEGGPLLTDSDAAWLSDSDAVFGDISSLPPSMTSNWLSDEADVDTDGDVDGAIGRAASFDTAAFEEAFAALSRLEGGKRGVDRDVGAETASPGMKQEYSDFWQAIQPLLGANSDSKAPRANESTDQGKVAQDLQTLLNGLGGET